MKKTLIGLALIFAFSVTKAEATNIVIDYIGETIVSSNNIEQALLIRSDDDDSYDIAVLPRQEYISNFDGSVQIPLENLYINNMKTDVFLKYNEYSILFRGDDMYHSPQSMVAKIKDFGIVPAGTYSINFEIQASDRETHEVAFTSAFTLNFHVPEAQELSVYNSEPARITVTASDAFTPNRQVPTISTTRLLICSNTDWILYLNTSDFVEPVADYYIRTTSGSGKVTNRLQDYALIQEGKEIILARGVAPSSNEYVDVEICVKSKDGKYIPAGAYNNRLRYILRKGEK